METIIKFDRKNKNCLILFNEIVKKGRTFIDKGYIAIPPSNEGIDVINLGKSINGYQHSPDVLIIITTKNNSDRLERMLYYKGKLIDRIIISL